MIDVYRAITGPRTTGETSAGVFLGVSVEELAARGICSSNDSPEQRVTSGLFQDYDGVMQRVIGLPVFLDRSRAVDWLVGGKRFRLADGRLAVLAQTAIDENLIEDGGIEIRKNALGWYSKDTTLTLRELSAHRDRLQVIRSECYIPRFPTDAMLGHTTLHLPRAFTPDGWIDYRPDAPLEATFTQTTPAELQQP